MTQKSDHTDLSVALRTFDGVTYDEATLAFAFDMVSDPGNWKAPIDRIIRDTDLTRRTIRAAVIFYTGTEAIFEEIPGSHNQGYVRVVAEGYLMGPCGP